MSTTARTEIDTKREAISDVDFGGGLVLAALGAFGVIFEGVPMFEKGTTS